MSKITYDTKTNVNAVTNESEQVTAGNMNEIKSSVNSLYDNKEDKGSFSADVDAKDHKVTNLIQDLTNNSAAINTSAVIAILTDYVQTHNPDLNFAGIRAASSGGVISKSENDAWIFYTAGEWQGINVVVGDIVYYTGSGYAKQSRYSIKDLRTYII
jgi:hypothetical protein